MTDTTYCRPGGVRLWDDATIQPILGSPDTEGVGSKSTRTSLTNKYLFGTVSNSLTHSASTSKASKLIGQIMKKDMNLGTFALSLGAPIRRIWKRLYAQCGTVARFVCDSGRASIQSLLRRLLCGLYSGAVHYEKYLNGKPRQIPVFDLVDAGPRHRFTTPMLTVHNCLGLGFGCGHNKFQNLAANSYGVDMDLDEAKRIVDRYRSQNPKVVAFWREHHTWLKVSAIHKHATHEVDLASGRMLRYHHPQFRGRDIIAYPVRGDNPRKLYGGLLTENEIQATARDLIKDAWIVLADEGLPPLWSMHDELIVEVPEEKAEESQKLVEQIMVSASPWAKGCPVEVESCVSKHYLK